MNGNVTICNASSTDRQTLARGRMIPAELERLVRESIDRGERPYFVNCTCGTTVLGAFDPINPIADICEKYNLWLHIDVSSTELFARDWSRGNCVSVS